MPETRDGDRFLVERPDGTVDVYRIGRGNRPTPLGQRLTRAQAADRIQLGLMPHATLWIRRADHPNLEPVDPAPCVVCGRTALYTAPTDHTQREPVCAEHYERDRYMRRVRTALTSEHRIGGDGVAPPGKLFEPAPAATLPYVRIRHGEEVSSITIRLIERHLLCLRRTDPTFSDELQTLAQSVVSAPALTSEGKQAVCALLVELMDSLVRDERHRRSDTAIRFLVQGVGRAIALVPNLVAQWQTLEPRVTGSV
jgi:hypothetical protein